jgi:hypothetical protein
MRKILFAAALLATSFTVAVGAGYDTLNVGIQYANDEAWDNAILWLGKALDAGDLLPDQARAAHYNRQELTPAPADLARRSPISTPHWHSLPMTFKS